MNTEEVAKLARAFLWMPALLVLVSLACNIRADAPTAVPAACPTGSQPVTMPTRPEQAADYAAAIARYLADGASPQDLERMLRNEWGVITDRWGTVNDDYDLNHDGLKDIVVTFFFANPNVPQPPGMMLILGCERNGGAGAYYNAFFAPATDPRDVTSLPQLIDNQLRDLNGDGWAEVAYFTVQCSSYICYHKPYIRSWNPSAGDGGEMVSLLPADLDDFFVEENRQEGVEDNPFAGFVAARFTFVGASNDNPDAPPLNLVIEEGAPGREAGLWRPRNLTLEWNNSTGLYNTPVVEEPAPIYYIHGLLDTDELLTTDPDAAIVSYQTLLDDRTLAFWGGIGWSQNNLNYEERILRTYTHYRLILAHAAAHTGSAQRELDAMQKDRTFAQGDIPTYFTLLAEDFVTAFLDAENAATALSGGCNAVDARFAARTWQVVWENMQTYLGSTAYYGPNIPAYALAELCPFN